MRFLFFIIFLIMLSCNASKKTNQADKMSNSFEASFTPGPPTIVYKTKADYSNLVPVILNTEKDAIVSYPSPNDLKIDGELRTPKQLKNGWLLDEKGINENVAYLSMTFQEFSNLKNAPSLDSMFSLLLDANPITEMCNCGNRNSFENAEEQLNSLIDDEVLYEKCKVIVAKK